jgi:hypothetical protein
LPRPQDSEQKNQPLKGLFPGAAEPAKKQPE